MESTGISDYLFTQGVLGVAVFVLGGVVFYQNKKLDRKEARIEELQELRLQDSKDVAKDVTAVLDGNAQAQRILAEKIEIARGAKDVRP
jgi:hypothetical protein